jgi:hypothetical protein
LTAASSATLRLGASVNAGSSLAISDRLALGINAHLRYTGFGTDLVLGSDFLVRFQIGKD